LDATLRLAAFSEYESLRLTLTESALTVSSQKKPSEQKGYLRPSP
jgi:hypothetical protein